MNKARTFALRHNASHRNKTAGAPTTMDDVWGSIDWHQFCHRAVIDNRIVQFVDVGSGPCVVLVHGQGGCWQWWLRLIPLLASDSRVIAIDLAGFGGSQIAERDVFDAQVATVIGVLDHCRIAKATLVGHSMGGMVTLATATAHPDRVEALALIDAGGGSISGARLDLILTTFRITNAVLQWSWLTRLLIAGPLLRRITFAMAVVDRRVVTRRIAAQIVPRLGSPGFIATLHAAASALEAIAPELIHCPTLVLWGSRDRILPVATGRNLAGRIQNAKFEQLENIGHCPMLEAPSELAAHLATIRDSTDVLADRVPRERSGSDGSSARASADR